MEQLGHVYAQSVPALAEDRGGGEKQAPARRLSVAQAPSTLGHLGFRRSAIQTGARSACNRDVGVCSLARLDSLSTWQVGGLYVGKSRLCPVLIMNQLGVMTASIRPRTAPEVREFASPSMPAAMRPRLALQIPRGLLFTLTTCGLLRKLSAAPASHLRLHASHSAASASPSSRLALVYRCWVYRSSLQ